MTTLNGGKKVKKKNKKIRINLVYGKKEGWNSRLGFWWNSKCKIWETRRVEKTGYILEFYDTDNKIDVQLYDPVEDGRHIVTLDLAKKIKDLEKGAVCEFIFEQHKAPLSKKVSEYLEKEIDMNAIYQFELKSLELLDVGSSGAADDSTEE